MNLFKNKNMAVVNNSNGKGTIIINGMKIETDGGSNITVSNGTVYVGNKQIQTGLSGNVKIEFIGNLASLNADGNVEVKGDVKGDIDCGGNCHCNNVGGSLDAGGNVNCGNVNGDVDAGGNVRMSK